ncbi:outer membrane beta-barrel protein [Ferruginibacter paludis]|uniref:outer membrane beta-barrel protein n=1 Tax=Ferruginibacter paludis TaxID=1310417 RepID=UPI0025B5A613|nr:outer membrane beta-barrel protein [Ferruginibacter paludis]MDN3656148.1 outer membrane beta-barrel protein [Ferruginibacter paludis]
MSRRLHNSDELFDSPEYGWGELKFLLDKNLPVKKTNRFSIVWIGIVASLTGLLLMSSLVIHDNIFQLASRNNYMANSTQTIALNAFQKEQQVVQPGRKSKFEEHLHQTGAGKELDVRVNVNTTEQPLLPGETADELIRIEHADLMHEEGVIVQNSPFRSIPHIIRPFIAEAGAMRPSGEESNKVQSKNRLQFSVGAAVNATPGQRQSLQPFPATEVLYKASSNFYISIGLTAGSVVTTSGQGVSKTVYLNDTANNIQFYNKVTRYTGLYYADIPLLAGLKMGKRWSVEGGLQASVLLNSNSKESIDKYDFQMRQANVPQNTFMGAVAAASENIYHVTPLKMDYRFVGGFRYSTHKTTFDLTYQYAFKPAFEGKQVTADRNQLLTLRVLYKLK